MPTSATVTVSPTAGRKASTTNADAKEPGAAKSQGRGAATAGRPDWIGGLLSTEAVVPDEARSTCNAAGAVAAESGAAADGAGAVAADTGVVAEAVVYAGVGTGETSPGAGRLRGGDVDGFGHDSMRSRSRHQGT